MPGVRGKGELRVDSPGLGVGGQHDPGVPGVVGREIAGEDTVRGIGLGAKDDEDTVRGIGLGARDDEVDLSCGRGDGVGDLMRTLRADGAGDGDGVGGRCAYWGVGFTRIGC